MKDNELKQMYDVFKKAFPEYTIKFQSFKDKLSWGTNTFLKEFDGETLVGFAIVRKNNLSCICVDPAYQHQGYGTNLLKQAEKIVKEADFTKISLGGGMFLACPLRGQEIKETFFAKHGYRGTSTCYEMYMKIDNFDVNHQPINYELNDVTFKYNDHSIEEVKAAVAKVSKDWVQFFEDEKHCFIAEKNGKIVGFCNTSFDDDTLVSAEGEQVGNVGCVGVIPTARKNGVGLTMVAYATEELRKHGCTIGHIHYTDLNHWYSKLGYHTYIDYWFGYKYL